MQVASVFQVIGDVLHRFNFKLPGVTQPSRFFADLLKRREDWRGLGQKVVRVGIETEDAMRLRRRTQALDGFAHQSLLRQEASEPGMT